MKATELRIGNLITHDVYNHERLEKQIENGDHIDQAIRLRAEPIPLTEEWLVKFGFEKAGNSYYKKSIGEYLELSWHFLHDNTLCIQTKGSGFKEPTHVVYVHQLQNLFNALTDEELTLNKTT